jgi:hypothetical protein
LLEKNLVTIDYADLTNLARYGVDQIVQHPIPSRVPRFPTASLPSISPSSYLTSMSSCKIMDSYPTALYPDTSLANPKMGRYVFRQSNGSTYFSDVNAIKGSVFIRQEQLFEDGNHGTAILLVMECLARSNVRPRGHPFELYIILSNLDERR